MSEPIPAAPVVPTADTSGMRFVNGLFVPAEVAAKVFEKRIVGFSMEKPK